MPFANIGDLEVHYLSTGSAKAPALLLSNSLGTNLSMWDPQVPAFEQHFRVVRYDTRGHGLSSVTPGPYTFDQLGKDVLGLLDILELDRVHFCGLSMGGMTGMWLGINAPERLNKLILCDTAAKIGKAETWNARIDLVRKSGMQAIAGGVIERWFSQAFRVNQPEPVELAQIMLQSASPEGYVANCAALRESDLRESISAIRAPTLVITGAHDPVTPPAEGHFLAEKIKGAKYVELSAAHLSNMEDRDRFNQEVSAFLTA
jgi:3-oxoadipate enol-lactonase